MQINSLTPAAVQKGKSYSRTATGQILWDTTRQTTQCVNLRERIPGTLEAINHSAPITAPLHPIIAIDIRDTQKNIFTLSPTLTLTLAGSIADDDTTFTPADITLATLPADVKSAASAGEFLILLLSDTTLYYIHYDDTTQTYTPLGPLPELPQPQFTPADITDITTTIPALTFATPVDDLRTSIPTDIRKQTATAIHTALNQALSQAHTAGMWVQPVTARLAIRLWDSRLLHITEPQTITLGYQPSTKITLPLTLTDSTFTGTQTSTLTLQAYHIALTIPQWQPGKWSKLIQALEIWITPEQDPLSSHTTLETLTHTATTTDYTLIATLPMRDTTTLASALPALKVSLLTSLPAATTSTHTLTLHPDLPLTTTPKADGFIRQASHIHSRSDILYIAHKADISTMHRSNPLTLACHTTGVGGQIHAISSQCIGGGAYTRQFVYLFTSQGIAALTHTSDATHTNCRIISPQIVTSPSLIAATPCGIFALSTHGTLLLIKDAKVSTIIASIHGCTQIGWDAAANELWLTPSPTDTQGWQRSIILQLYTSLRAYYSTEIPGKFLPGQGTLFHQHTSTLSPTAPLLKTGAGSQATTCTFTSAPLTTPSHTPLKAVTLGLSDTSADCTLTIHAVSPLTPPQPTTMPHTDTPLLTATIQGTIDTPTRIPLIHPSSPLKHLTLTPHYKITLTGRFATLLGITLH